MAADSPESLRALRDRVASLQVTRCRMLHERVRVENGVVLRVWRGEPEPTPVRVGLCSPEERARNLACGHTMARYVLLDAVAALRAAGRLTDAEHDPLRRALESVSDAIHLLDHRKGHAEKALALRSEADSSSRNESAAEVRRLEEEHDALAGRIRELQGAVLARLDAAVRGSAAGPEPEPN
jgi:hypothetical protein